MSQKWRNHPIITNLIPTITFAHFHEEVSVPISDKVPTGKQKALVGTAAVVEYNGSSVVAFSLIAPGDNGSRAIGREIASGRLLKQIASESAPPGVVKAPKSSYIFKIKTEAVEHLISILQTVPCLRYELDSWKSLRTRVESITAKELTSNA